MENGTGTIDTAMHPPGDRPVRPLANISGREAAQAFAHAGWQAAGQVGSHLVMTKPGERVNLCIPLDRELSVGALRALIRAAGMTI